MILFDGIQYVVKFENGKYYAGGFSSESQTDSLERANKYTFDWQVVKDMYLSVFLNEYPMKYELIKVRTHYEIVK